MGWVDLHLHTRYSDGDWLPVDLVSAAARRGLIAIAVTDHDTMQAIPETLAAADKLRAAGQPSPEVIAGVELTCRLDHREIHLLGYFPGETWRSPLLQQVMLHARQVRHERGQKIVASLARLGFPVPWEDVEALARGGAVGRPHVALALVQRGYVENLDEAFRRFLRRGRPAYVERYRMTVREAIGHVQRAGGVAVLAHPGIAQVDHRLADLAAQGLDGIEAWHSRHSPAQVERYRQIAARLGLLVTGGSDCHGRIRGDPLLGTVKVPDECLHALRCARKTDGTTETNRTDSNTRDNQPS